MNKKATGNIKGQEKVSAQMHHTVWIHVKGTASALALGSQS